MFILINNTNREEVVFYYLLGEDWKEKKFKVKNGLPVLFYFDKLLKGLKKKKTDVLGLAVLIGEGSFTSTRIAVTLVNTLAYALEIPVIGVKKIEFDNLKEKITSTKVGQYVSAKYSGEPNIGVKKVKK